MKEKKGIEIVRIKAEKSFVERLCLVCVLLFNFIDFFSFKKNYSMEVRETHHYDCLNCSSLEAN